MANDSTSVRISADTSQFDAGMRSAVGSLESLSKAFSDPQRGAEMLAGSLKRIGHYGAGGLITVGFGSFAKDILDAGLSAERLANQLKFVSGSSIGAAQEMSYLREATNRIGVDFTSAAQAYGKLAAASKGTALEGQRTRDIFESVSKASTVMGLSSDETSGALLALSQMMSKGTVQAEELRGQLGERIPGAFQIAARAMGVTTAELGKMLENGEVMASSFLPRFADELMRTLGDAPNSAAASAQAELNRLNSSWDQFKQALSNSGILTVAANGMRILSAGVESLNLSLDSKITARLADLERLEKLRVGEAATGEDTTTTDRMIVAGRREVIALQEKRRAEADAARTRAETLDADSRREAGRAKAVQDAVAVDGEAIKKYVEQTDRLGDAAKKRKAIEDEERAYRRLLADNPGASAAQRADIAAAHKASLAAIDEKFKGKQTREADPVGDALEGYRRDALAEEVGLSSSTVKEIENLGELIARGKIGVAEYDRLLATVLNKDSVLKKEQDNINAGLKAEAEARQYLATIGEKFSRANEAKRDSFQILSESQSRLNGEMRKLDETADSARDKLARMYGDGKLSAEAYAREVEALNALLAGQREEVLALNDEQTRLNGSWEHGAARALQKYKDEAANVAGSVEQAFTRGFGAMEDALVQFTTTGKFSFTSLANSVISDLIRMQYRAMLSGETGPLQGIFGKLFGLGGSSPLPASAASLPTAELGTGVDLGFASILHDGGIAGRDGGSRQVPMSLFAGAQRFHAGGWPGLASDEVPAILQKGERVWSRGEVAGGGTAPVININVRNEGAADGYQAQAQTRRNSGGGIDVDLIVRKVMMADLGKNGPMTQAIGNAFGLSRGG